MKPSKLQRNKKNHKIYVGRSTTVHTFLFCAHTLWLNYVTVTFLLVSSSGANHDLLCLCRVKDKKANKKQNKEFCQASYLYTPNSKMADNCYLALDASFSRCSPAILEFILFILPLKNYNVVKENKL